MSGLAFGVGAGGSGDPCPCGSGRGGAHCCEPLLSGQAQARTAEELMRSRYTAHVRGDVDHLVRTWHPTTRPAELTLDPGTQWTGLVVHRTVAGGPQDGEGTVEFTARHRSPGARGPVDLHEVSRFVRRRGRWVYLGPR